MPVKKNMTPEEMRIKALELAIQFARESDDTEEWEVLETAKTFEDYIGTGAVPSEPGTEENNP
jgi:hypothetical protein